MKKKDLTALKLKTVVEVEKLAHDALEELEKMMLEGVNGRVINRISVKNKKHDIAQLLTVLTEKKGAVTK